MKTYVKYLLALAMVLALGFVAAGTVTAGEEPLWRNFVNETTLSGTAPEEEALAQTVPIWQTQLEGRQKANRPVQADRQAYPAALAETTPIWGAQCKCI